MGHIMGILFNFNLCFITIFFICSVSNLSSEMQEVNGDFHLLFYLILYCLFFKKTRNMYFTSNLEILRAYNVLN